ncbi:MAG: 2-oxoacid:acceptor oxidoreductase subunit alpha [Chloroflexi bacterium]|nr:2-oxoacid:acceptor oxidoreductase subunit alpha [Chloroflexota bacterium]
MEVNLLVGGEAGQGVQTIGYVLSKVMSRGGFHVFADQDYESRIRGGHNFFRVRASDNPVHALADQVDILIALNKETIDIHRREVRESGSVIFDNVKVTTDLPGNSSLGMPLEKLAAETTGDKLMTSAVAIGAAFGLLHGDFQLLSNVLSEQFARAGAQVAEGNIKAARAGYDEAARRSPERKPLQVKAGAHRLLLSGSEALALGSMAAGVRFVAAYPMTPTTPILEFLAEKQEQYGLVVIQPEDEIAAINAIVGAAYAGVRAMTATSGSGFCLMTEGLGLSGITETPVVIVLGQRPGPAVGLPTRTEQGELLFACYAGTGEFPRAVLAPATIEDSFRAADRALNLAEKYQAPVIIMTDHLLSTSYQTVDGYDLKKVAIERGALAGPAEAGDAGYKRHLVTESGVSPRAFPLQGRALVVTDADEHNEEGHLIEDAQTRRAQVLKRLRKLNGLRGETSQPWSDNVPGAATTLVGWGSTYGAIKEATLLLRDAGTPVNHLHLDQVWPFPAAAVADALRVTKHSFVVENNATGQLATLISSESGIRVSGGINKFDGRPFSPPEIVAGLKEVS